MYQFVDGHPDPPAAHRFESNAALEQKSQAMIEKTQTQDSSSPAALVVKIRLRRGVYREFSSWHARMATAPTATPGFTSAEVDSPAARDGNEWTVVQHFRSANQMRAWSASAEHVRLLEEAKSLVDQSDPDALREEQVTDGGVNGIVTEVVTTYVRPGKDREYQNWAQKVHCAEAQFPGYRGGFLQPPASDQQHYWTTLVRFATPEQLEAWLKSGVRQDLLREHKMLVKSWEHHRLPSSFAGWFPTDAKSGESPASWKQSLLVILMLFPIVMLERRFLAPLTAGMNPAEGTFIGNVISVFLLAWVCMPVTIAAMKWWLLPREDAGRWLVPAGIAILIVLYAGEIAVLSFLA